VTGAAHLHPGASPLRAAPPLETAYRFCWQLARSHYENFTLGSWLLPRRLRRHIAAIYAFARVADDFADEGTVPAPDRRRRLDEWERSLEASYRGEGQHPIFVALGHTARTFDIPIEPFRRLLDAFRQDVDFQRFPTFADLRDYCRRSADPVGHLVLYLFGYRDGERQALSDQICSGLQLANFWQDIAVDAAKGRLYVPLDDVERFACAPDDVLRGHMTPNVRHLLAFQVQRARQMLTDGLQLVKHVERRLGREVELFAWGGLAILDRIVAQDYDVFGARPVLSKGEKGRLVWRALVGARSGGAAKPLEAARAALRDGRETTRPSQGEQTQALESSSQPFGLRRPRLLRGRLEARAAVSVEPFTSSVQPAGVCAAPIAGTPASVSEAYKYCQEVTRRSASNFYYAFRLLPEAQRAALFAVYAFCRFVDDVADDDGRREPASLLARWREELAAVYDGQPSHPIGRALADAARRFPLQQRHFLELIRGVEMDLTRRRYATFEDLYEYCYLVASTVGLLCVEIFGYRNPTARDYAVDLGIAFQLTNILRDVPEDARRERIYLPLEDLRRFNCSEDDLLAGRYSPRVGALMAFECGRARAYYLRARGALAPEDRGSMVAAEAMRLIYERLLDRIESRRFDVFGEKVTLPQYEKVTLALTAWGRSQWRALRS
jgi:phytoene synthase